MILIAVSMQSYLYGRTLLKSFVDITAIDMVDKAYQDRAEWIKKTIRVVAKVVLILFMQCKRLTQFFL
jgi:hypothetical protein